MNTQHVSTELLLATQMIYPLTTSLDPTFSVIAGYMYEFQFKNMICLHNACDSLTQAILQQQFKLGVYTYTYPVIAMNLLLRFLYAPYQLLKKCGIKGPTPTPFFGHYKERVKMVRMPLPILPSTPHPQPSLVSQHGCRCDVMVVILCTRTLPPPPISRMC